MRFLKVFMCLVSNSKVVQMHQSISYLSYVRKSCKSSKFYGKNTQNQHGSFISALELGLNTLGWPRCWHVNTLKMDGAKTIIHSGHCGYYY